jgi:hypothetical protein
MGIRMPIGHDWFRDLYQGLMGDLDGEAAGRLLAAREGGCVTRLGSLAPLRVREPEPLTWKRGSGGGAEERGAAAALHGRLWELYALGRISDYLLERGCPAGDGARGFSGGRRLAPEWLAVYERFMRGIGLAGVGRAAAFSPFHHEIFEVVRDEEAGAVTVEDVLWPGFRFGDLLICRAGVRVRAPSALVDPRVATTSTLYFTSRRQPRGARDLSHGWGSNSRWRTLFSRFYDDAEGLHFNWDGETDLGTFPDAPTQERGTGDNPELPMDRRVELLVHRCFVRSPPPADEWDWFPFGDRLSVRHGAPPP